MTEVTRKTVKEIVEETAAAYTVTSRSYDSVRRKCYYNGPDNRHCAFARLCIDPEEDLADREGWSASRVLTRLGQSILKPEYRGYLEGFYDDLQLLHDYTPFWNETGLSERGREWAKEIIEKYSPKNVNTNGKENQP